MIWLIIGLSAFIAMHSVSLFSPAWRAAFIERKGSIAWQGLYSIISLIGIVLIVWGYGQTRLQPVFIWQPPAALVSVTIILTLIAFVFIVAVNVPHNHFKTWVGHPMIIGVKIWAFSHLLSNGRLGDILLFGAFLIWAIVYYVINRRRDRASGEVVKQTPNVVATVVTITIGAVVWFVFGFWVHRYLIGVSPFGA